MTTDREALLGFASRVDTALQPGFSEILSEETRKTQRFLLVVCFALFLIAFSAVKFSGNIDMMGVKFEGLTARTVVLVVGSIIAAYLELLVAVRCFAEWHSWRLRARVGELSARSVEEEFSQLVAAAQADVSQRGLAFLRADLTKEQITAAPTALRGPLERLAQLHSQAPHYSWFRKAYSAYDSARRTRLLIEVSFPLSFAAVAITVSIRAALGE